MAVVTMRQLLEAGIHFGHQTRRWNPKMGRYIFGQRNGIYIIDLQKTLKQLIKAYVTVRDVVANGGLVLFVGTKKQAQEPVAREAQRCGMFYVNNRWLGGTLTNWETVRQSVRTLQRLEDLDATGKMAEQFTKKEGIQMRKQISKLDANLCGIKNMPRLPDIMFVIDAKKEAIAVREAERLNIPCIGIVDTNCDPDVVPIPVPGNDDAIRAVQLFCSVISEAVMEGRMKGDKILTEQEALRRKAETVAIESAPRESVDLSAVVGDVEPEAIDDTKAELDTDSKEELETANE